MRQFIPTTPYVQEPPWQRHLDRASRALSYGSLSAYALTRLSGPRHFMDIPELALHYHWFLFLGIFVTSLCATGFVLRRQSQFEYIALLPLLGFMAASGIIALNGPTSRPHALLLWALWFFLAARWNVLHSAIKHARFVQDMKDSVEQGI